MYPSSQLQAVSFLHPLVVRLTHFFDLLLRQRWNTDNLTTQLWYAANAESFEWLITVLTRVMHHP